MSLVDEARKLSPSDIALAIGAFVSVVTPGFLTLYLYKPALIGSLDTFKVLIFSAGLTLPVVVLNHIVASLLDEEKGKGQYTVTLTLAMGISCLVLYLALLVSYLATLTFKWYLATIFGMQVLLFLALYLDQRLSK